MSNLIFTDAIKDVIGNQPVLDQFDISYVASFYGTTGDDYVTGTMVREITNNAFLGSSTGKTFVTGTRGRAFSVYYAEDYVPLSETSAAAIAINPRVSSRVTPAHTLVSYNYRLSQCIDESERFYDTCLPSLKNSFSVDGAEIWTYTGSIQGFGTETSSVSEEDDIAYIFSPYKNVDTTNVGYMLFNNVEYTRQGTQYANDPLTNNHWTWSYPYENRYSPTVRFLKTKDALQVERSNLVTNKNLSQILKTPIQKKIDKFFPILPGKNLSEAAFSEGGRNGLRPVIFGEETILLGSTLFPTGAAVDGVFGLSQIIPSDVNLNETVSHSYLSAYPGITQPIDAPLTGTTTYNDIIKFLYGFGDLNNLTYGVYTLDATKQSRMYYQNFERIGNTDWGNSNPSSYPNFADKIATVSSATGTINWSNSFDVGGWSSVKYQSTARTSYNRSPTQQFFFVSSSYKSFPSPFGPLIVPVRYVAWPATSSIGAKDEYVLGSATGQSAFSLTDTKVIYDYIPEGASSIAYVDVTASNPWNFTYDRTIHADPSDRFQSYWAGYPGSPSHTNPPIVNIETLPGFSPSGSILEYALLESYNGYANTFLPPGEYRIGFAYIKGGGPTGDIDRAFINNFTINQLDLLSNPQYAIPVTSSLIGCNNYPDFYRYKIDTRNNPIEGNIVTGGTVGVSGSNGYYRSLHYGIAPVIRGWKYGLYSGFPTHSKCIFRRDKFGQFRDMLEQRPYTKYITNESATEPFADAARPNSGNSHQQFFSKILYNKPQKPISPGPGPVEVKFLKQRYQKDERGIGKIVLESVSPELTFSQNLSTEVTSSQPYTDGVSRLRDDYTASTNSSISSIAISQFGNITLT